MQCRCPTAQRSFRKETLRDLFRPCQPRRCDFSRIGKRRRHGPFRSACGSFPARDRLRCPLARVTECAPLRSGGRKGISRAPGGLEARETRKETRHKRETHRQRDERIRDRSLFSSFSLLGKKGDFSESVSKPSEMARGRQGSTAVDGERLERNSLRLFFLGAGLRGILLPTGASQDPASLLCRPPGERSSDALQLTAVAEREQREILTAVESVGLDVVSASLISLSKCVRTIAEVSYIPLVVVEQ